MATSALKVIVANITNLRRGSHWSLLCHRQQYGCLTIVDVEVEGY